MKLTDIPGRHLDFQHKISVLVNQTKKHLALCYSPKRTEFEFCALLAAWESTTLHDSKASHWLDVWQKYCHKRHHGTTGSTLADPVENQPLSERWHVTQEETLKAYATVREGLRHVFKTTLDHYCSGECSILSLSEGTDIPAILFQSIRAAFKTTKSIASPEGLEVFLLTLIELFEQSHGAAENNLFSRKVWHSEIRRRRLGGSAETRTLTDVAPVAIRLERQRAFPEKERNEILLAMLSSMRQITKELQTYLRKRTPKFTEIGGVSALLGGKGEVA
jgi:hypothetical protein